MRVVVAYDGGDAGDRAIAAIANWIRSTDADVHMLTVMDSSATTETAMPPGVHGFQPAGTWAGQPIDVHEPLPKLAETRSQAIEGARSLAEERLHDVAQRNFGTVSVAVHAELSDHTAEVIVAEARRLGADVIAIGTHGRGGLRHALMGSVAEKVIRTATVPVLVVGPAVVAPAAIA
ncbi:MAG: universal stress protein [Tepidiformaceae bacterium]